MTDDTISAVATAMGEGGIGIIRVSGDKAICIAGALFQSASGRNIDSFRSHEAVYGRVIDPKSGEVVDEALLIIMKAPHSYTTEDVVEFQCHGGSAALRRILALTLTYGARLAEPGEFTKRAFLNGRLDLVQAEAVMDVIRAKTDASLKQAVGHLEGALSKEVGQLRHNLLAMIAQLEAMIDFPDEDIEEMTLEKVAETTQEIHHKVEILLASAESGRMIKDGIKTVIIGKPNVGKSSLLNALVKEQRAIVTSVPGTTRDSIEEYVSVRGVPLRLIDTAGIHETDDLVEKIGVEKAHKLLESADLVLLLLDRSRALSEEDRKVISLVSGQKGFVLLNKTDLEPLIEQADVAEFLDWPLIPISVETGEGIDVLEEQIIATVYSGEVTAESVYVANLRQQHSLERAAGHLRAALGALEQSFPVDCVVIDLRSAWEFLGEVTGETVQDDLLDQIFSQFCIGK
ncbi:MAG: tRNA uridine-5-carboxymethylaminomethyl(34) synthesis GTPase MnmE [Sporomusaceae bacterium]|nr:tRNA uridine-5-carboxymethylaminomethyl(34) synthesis GTPase MnmE [Sporomusaceae bacterium]